MRGSCAEGLQLLRKGPYRLLTSLFMPSSVAAGLVSLALLYSLRHIERYMGSGRFGAFALLSMVFAQPINLGALVVFGDALKRVEGGPLPLVFAMLTLHHCSWA